MLSSDSPKSLIFSLESTRKNSTRLFTSQLRYEKHVNSHKKCAHLYNYAQSSDFVRQKEKLNPRWGSLGLPGKVKRSNHYVADMEYSVQYFGWYGILDKIFHISHESRTLQHRYSSSKKENEGAARWERLRGKSYMPLLRLDKDRTKFSFLV